MAMSIISHVLLTVTNGLESTARINQVRAGYSVPLWGGFFTNKEEDMPKFFTWIVCNDNNKLRRFESEKLASAYLDQLVQESPEVAKECRVEKMYHTIC